MPRIALAVAVAVAMCFATACGRSTESSTQQAESKRPAITFVGPDQTLDSGLVVALSGCKLNFNIKAGMNNREANDAIDTSYEAYLTCLRNKGRTTGTP